MALFAEAIYCGVIIVQVRELYTSGQVCPHPSKTYMQADTLNFKGEYKVNRNNKNAVAFNRRQHHPWSLHNCLQVYDPKFPGFPSLGVPTMQVALKPTVEKAHFYVAAISTSAEVCTCLWMQLPTVKLPSDNVNLCSCLRSHWLFHFDAPLQAVNLPLFFEASLVQ